MRLSKRFSKRVNTDFTCTSGASRSPSWLSLSQQAPPVLNAPSIRCLKHLHLVGCCCILGDVVPLSAIVWCGSQTSTRTPHPSDSWPIVMPQCVRVCVCASECECVCVCLCVCACVSMCARASLCSVCVCLCVCVRVCVCVSECECVCVCYIT